jgi:flagellar motor protein MotB
MWQHRFVSLMCGLVVSTTAVAQTVTQSQLGEGVERHLSSDEPVNEWLRDPDTLHSEAGDRFELQDVAGEALETVKLTNVIPPIHFESGVADIPEQYVERLRKALDEVRDRRNVRLHLVGHADTQPLSPALARVYQDNAGLSRERAGQVAEFLQRALMLPPEAMTYEWAGDTRPIATNATEEGRALNRRVAVEVWYDQPKELSAQQEVLVAHDFKKVKVCRMETLCKLRFMEGHERRARIKNLVPPLHYEDETTDVSPEFIEHIRKALHNLEGKQNVVVKFIGYTDDVPLAGRNARIYGVCRARHWRAMAAARPRRWPATRPPRDVPSTAASKCSSGTTILCRSCRTSRNSARRPMARSGQPRSTTRPGAASHRSSSSRAARSFRRATPNS